MSPSTVTVEPELMVVEPLRVKSPLKVFAPLKVVLPEKVPLAAVNCWPVVIVSAVTVKSPAKLLEPARSILVPAPAEVSRFPLPVKVLLPPKVMFSPLMVRLAPFNEPAV